MPADWERIFPSKIEEAKIEKITNKEVKATEQWLTDLEIKADVVPVGSTVKGTFLKGVSDVDIFVVSPQYERLFGYVRYWKPEGRVKRGELLIWTYRKNGFEVDLVFIPPDYPKIDTLKHTEFYKSALTKEMKNEVRKAKAFFISVGTYKAEVGGITGVAIEELIRQHKTLEGLCRFVVDNRLEDVWLQDPTTSRPRNLLASIDPVRWDQMQKVCQELLEGRKPRLRIFDLTDFKRLHKDKKIVECKRQFDRATDFMTALSLCKRSGNELRSLEEDVKYACDAYVDDSILIAFKATPEVLPPKREVCIPKKLKEAIDSFKRVHPDVKVYQRENYVCGLVERRVVNANAFIGDSLVGRMKERGYVCEVVI